MVYFLIAVIWLIIMCFPITAFLLATRGEIQLGSEKFSGARVFLVNDSDVQGIGLQWNRRQSQDSTCIESTLRYMLWSGTESDVNTHYCWCYDRLDQSAQITGTCPSF